jgi:hypothetical protein
MNNLVVRSGEKDGKFTWFYLCDSGGPSSLSNGASFPGGKRPGA